MILLPASKVWLWVQRDSGTWSFLKWTKNHFELHRHPDMSLGGVEVEYILILLENLFDLLLELGGPVPRWMFSVILQQILFVHLENMFFHFLRNYFLCNGSFRLDFRCVHRFQLLTVRLCCPSNFPLRTECIQKTTALGTNAGESWAVGQWANAMPALRRGWSAWLSSWTMSQTETEDAQYCQPCCHSPIRASLVSGRLPCHNVVQLRRQKPCWSNTVAAMTIRRKQQLVCFKHFAQSRQDGNSTRDHTLRPRWRWWVCGPRRLKPEQQTCPTQSAPPREDNGELEKCTLMLEFLHELWCTLSQYP